MNNTQNDEVKCPYCGSTDIARILSGKNVCTQAIIDLESPRLTRPEKIEASPAVQAGEKGWSL